MVKKKATKEMINLMINTFKNGVADTRKEVFEIYFGINNEYQFDLDSESEFENSNALIKDFIRYVGTEDKVYLGVEEQSNILKVIDTLTKYNSKQKALELLKYSQGEVANLEWLNAEEEMYYINQLSMPILEYAIKKYININFE